LKKVGFIYCYLKNSCNFYAGDMVPADGLCVEHFSLVIDESAMTGESDMIEKNEDAPFMISGCLVCDGMGKRLVIAVGKCA